MKHDNLTFKLLTNDNIREIVVLGQQLHQKLTLKQVEEYQNQMFEFSTYNCFGLFLNDQLIGISSGWITIRLYSGKQFEVDNVIINSSDQSKGYGKKFFEFIENWAKQNGCKTIELNTYVKNSRSHKFYYNIGYSIIGFHFWKHLRGGD
ncbi:MAG: GNAT family N-acetyltransferase [Flavobacteriales bacterium MED-G15]|nr:MAG: GNAT family N-acetyltransferase [Flavobacteriales bacterium MED-G15]|tara:strand:- start:3182 stop:3628 length:447 start_codon:yes stop_codon:yes gene_type:complete